jgi:hypothetical protein
MGGFASLLKPASLQSADLAAEPTKQHMGKTAQAVLCLWLCICLGSATDGL